jgi:alanyl-tRNA synthetase
MTTRTQRLYRRDSFLTRFKATVLDARIDHAGEAEGSARLAVVLDQSAFYPTGGGQPHDRGRLAGLPVVDVRESDEGTLHIVEMRDERGRPHGAHLTVGEVIEGEVDWKRRFDHMQQHSGQHILSRAFLEVATARTRSFHLGEETCAIDVEIPNPDEDGIRGAEARANEIVWDDRAVDVREIPFAEIPGEMAGAPALADLDLAPGDALRLIEIQGFDSTPCGGTHVARAGQVGLVGVTSWERFKGMCRVTFVCGGRAASHLRQASGTLASCVAKLSARPHELPNAVDRLLLDREELMRRVRALGGEIAALEAARFGDAAPQAGRFRLLRRVFRSKEKSVEDVQALIRAFIARPGRLAVVAITGDGVGTLLAARSDVEGPPDPAHELPKMGDVIVDLCRRLGGRGGGGTAQARAGNIPEASVEEAIDGVVARHLAGTPIGSS